MLRKLFQTWPGWADKNFQGGTNFFSTIVEKFYPRIKIFRGIIFFLTVHRTTFNNDAHVNLFCYYCLLHVHVPLMLIWLVKPFVEMK